MKKIIAVILSLAIVFGACAVFAYATKDEDLKFALASDLHYNIPRDELEGPIDDEVYWYANRRAAMEDESGFIIDEFLRQCAESDVEYVLVSGDIVDNGRAIAQEHYDVAEKFAAFEAATGKQIFVINGNHDAGNNSETTVEQFKQIYADFGYDHALTVDEGNCSYTANLGDKYRLIALDSCNHDASTEDGMTAERIDWVCKQADAAKADGRYPILMMHHNLLDHMPIQTILSSDFIVKFHYTTAEIFADHGIKLVFSGHEHCSDATSYTSALGNVIYDFATTSLTMYPLEYRVFTLNDDEINYEAKAIESIDLEALTARVSGYTDAQLVPMAENLNDYAKGFLKAGVEYRLELSLSMEKMGIAEDAVYFDLVNTAVGGLLEILNMPLYGQGSVSSLASNYNIDIPYSKYETPWDLATDLVAMHYAGEEAFDLDSPEVRILLRTVALILHADLATVTDEVFLSAATDLLNMMGISGLSQEITKACARFFGGITPMEYFLVTLVAPLLYAFAYDDDGVNDNNGTLEGYGTVTTESNISNIFTNIIETIKDAGFNLYLMLKAMLTMFGVSI